jgi:phage terminase large subunit-like protein
MTEFQLPTDGEHNPYEFLFSRLRRLKGMPVPLRVRAGSNPGNVGHAYVKRRFVTEAALAHLRDGGGAEVFYCDAARSRAFVPALLDDNPFIDKAEYVKGLMHLPPVTRARLLSGDWAVIEEALIRAEWLRSYRMRGQILVPLNRDLDALKMGPVDERGCYRLATIDTAGTSKQKASERKGKPPSWSVCQIWDFWPQYKFLFLRHVWRARVDWHGLKDGVRQTLKEWGPAVAYIENAHHGPPLYSELEREFSYLTLVNPVMEFMKGQGGVPGKVERATPLLTMLERGQIFLPEGNNSWLPDLEAEWLSWTGDPDETADQIDCAAYAAALEHVRGLHGDTMVMESVLGR